MMVDWSHGYDVSVGYTYGFYREMAPDWLDLCTRIAGFVPPRRDPSSRFRYLELGTGQGLGLCLLAAANTQGDFLGIDFHPDHIAHAEAIAAMAGLTNVRFLKADFIELAAHWSEDFGTFDYVALHGVYSWVPPRVRESLIQCLSHATRSGSLVYNSYNSQPGWLGGMAFQHIARRLKETTGKPGDAVFEESIALFEALGASDAAIFKHLPGLKARIDMVKRQDANYLIQEYLHESWHPLWHTEVANELRRANLDYVGTATVAEAMLPALLPAPMREILAGQRDGGLRQDLQDTMINQSFRRDIFCCGPRRDISDDMSSVTRLYLTSAIEPGASIEVHTAFGTTTIGFPDFAEIAAALGSGPQSIDELAALPGMREKGWPATSRILVLLVHSGMVGLAAAEQNEGAASHRLNAVIARAASQGAPYKHVAASRLGSAISITQLDLMLIDSWIESSEQADSATLVRAMAERIAKAGIGLSYEGEPVEGAAVEQYIATMVQSFLDTGLVYWRRLGVLP